MVATPSAKSSLFQICAAQRWSSPTFILCREEVGPSYQKMYTYKVIVKVETISSTLLECFSEPKSQKIIAQEHASEGAIWFLKHLGYLPEN